MSDPEPLREYSPTELKALRAVTSREWKGSGDPAERGPAQFATGAYWPTELRRRAREFRRLARLYDLAASAMEREIENDPRTGALQ